MPLLNRFEAVRQLTLFVTAFEASEPQLKPFIGNIQCRTFLPSPALSYTRRMWSLSIIINHSSSSFSTNRKLKSGRYSGWNKVIRKTWYWSSPFHRNATKIYVLFMVIFLTTSVRLVYLAAFSFTILFSNRMRYNHWRTRNRWSKSLVQRQEKILIMMVHSVTLTCICILEDMQVTENLFRILHPKLTYTVLFLPLAHRMINVVAPFWVFSSQKGNAIGPFHRMLCCFLSESFFTGTTLNSNYGLNLSMETDHRALHYQSDIADHSHYIGEWERGGKHNR